MKWLRKIFSTTPPLEFKIGQVWEFKDSNPFTDNWRLYTIMDINGEYIKYEVEVMDKNRSVKYIDSNTKNYVRMLDLILIENSK